MISSVIQEITTSFILLIVIAVLAYRHILTNIKLKTLKAAIDNHAIYSRTNAKGTIIEVNSKFEQVSGYSGAELIGQNHSILNSQYHDATFFKRMWNTINAGRPWTGIVRNQSKSGGHYWVKSTIIPFKNAFGKIAGFSALRTEMTDVKVRGDAALEILELLDFIHDEIVIFSPLTRKILYANQVALDAHAVQEHELKECSIERFGLERDAREFEQNIQELLSGSTTHSKHTSSIYPTKKNGKRRTFQHWMTKHENSKGEIKIVVVTREISGQMRLRAQVRHMGKMIESSKVPIVSFDAQSTRFTYFNQSLLELYGYSKDEFKNLSPGKLRSHQASAEDVHLGLVQNEDPASGLVSYQVPHRRKDGSEFICNVNLSRYTNSDGSIEYFGTFNDVSDQHESQQKLARLSSALDVLDDEIYLLDPNTLKFLYLNEKSRKRLPDPSCDYSNMSHGDLFPTFKPEKFKAMLEPILAGETKVTLVNRSLPNTPFTEIATQLLMNEDARPIVINQIRDISKRIQFESEMAQLRTAVDSSEDIIFVLAPDTLSLDYINGSGRARFARPEDGSRRVLLDCFPELSADIIQGINDGLAGDITLSHTVETHDVHNALYEVKFQANRSDFGGKLIAVARDITSRRELENNKRKLMSAVSHELRTPITSIKGALAVLATGALETNPSAATELAVVANGTSDKLVRLVNDIVDMEKIGSGKFEVYLEPLNILEVLHEAIEQNTQYASQFNVDLRFIGHDDDIMVLGDRLRLNQILDNLISNAAKFSDGAAEVHIGATILDQTCCITVRDFGKGIPEDALDSIFDAFQQIGRSDTRMVRGSGLGLSIVKELVAKHNGTVKAQSTIGEGTEFIVLLPRFIDQGGQ